MAHCIICGRCVALIGSCCLTTPLMDVQGWRRTVGEGLIKLNIKASSGVLCNMCYGNLSKVIARRDEADALELHFLQTSVLCSVFAQRISELSSPSPTARHRKSVSSEKLDNCYFPKAASNPYTKAITDGIIESQKQDTNNKKPLKRENRSVKDLTVEAKGSAVEELPYNDEIFAMEGHSLGEKTINDETHPIRDKLTVETKLHSEERNLCREMSSGVEEFTGENPSVGKRFPVLAKLLGGKEQSCNEEAFNLEGYSVRENVFSGDDSLREKFTVQSKLPIGEEILGKEVSLSVVEELSGDDDSVGGNLADEAKVFGSERVEKAIEGCQKESPDEGGQSAEVESSSRENILAEELQIFSTVAVQLCLQSLPPEGDCRADLMKLTEDFSAGFDQTEDGIVLHTTWAQLQGVGTALKTNIACIAAQLKPDLTSLFSGDLLSEFKQTDSAPTVEEIEGLTILHGSWSAIKNAETRIRQLLRPPYSLVQTDTFQQSTGRDNVFNISSSHRVEIEYQTSATLPSVTCSSLASTNSEEIGNYNYTCHICKVKVSMKTLNSKLLTRRYKGKTLFVCYPCSKPYRCPLCKLRFKSADCLKIHKRNRHTVYRCTNCEETFKSKDALRLHAKTHTFPCSVCDKTFRHKCTLKNHAIKHSSDRPFPCSVCGKTFKHALYLRRHAELHGTDKLYKCSYCNKKFLTKNALRSHTWRHTAKKKYVCNICGYACISSSVLKHHAISHSAKRKFVCAICGRAFKFDYSLQQHKKWHRGEKSFVCDVCGTSFPTRERRTKHINKVHRGEVTLPCSMCKKTFNSDKGLKVHISLVHRHFSLGKDTVLKKF